MARRIPTQTLEEILLKSDVVGIFGRYLKMRQQGKNYLALCPFHSERTPSFSISPEKKGYHCFGCQESGSLFQFVMRMEGLTFPQAVQRLGEECGVRVELEEEGEERSERDRLLQLVERSVQFYAELLEQSPVAQEARDYLQGRGLSVAMRARFRLGWAPAGPGALVKQLQAAGFRPEEGVLSGLLRERDGRVLDTLRSRIVFPICDPQDRPIALGGRLIGEGQPKYLNTPESPVYSKRQQLFALNLARGPASRAEEAIVAEGYLDVIMLHQAGFDRAVASLGTSLTSEQAALLRRYVKNVVLAYDSDRAGENATVKAIGLFEEAGLRVRVAVLPRGQDPDSLIRSAGPEVMATRIEQAESVIDYMMQRAEQRNDLSTPEGKEDYSREVLPVVGALRDPVRKDAYMRRVANKLQVSESRLAWKMPREAKVDRSPKVNRAARFDPEERLLRILAHSPTFISVTRQHLGPEDFAREDLRPLVEALFAMEGREQALSLADLSAFLEEEGMLRKWTELLVHEPPESTADDVLKLILPIRDRVKQRRLEELRREVVPAMEAGLLSSDDERFREYLELNRYFRKVAQ
jgi:DNA primase